MAVTFPRVTVSVFADAGGANAAASASAATEPEGTRTSHSGQP